ncbi:MAG TPA: hypothetical protein VND54_05265 [Candidatus Saccharimonadales bacterium]|nr:hypothetical protein [Candidatus Saccharimonadales bacterium]
MVVAFAVVAALYTVSMFLSWVGVFTQSGRYVIVDGLRQANWLLAVAAALVALAVRVSLAAPSGVVRFVFVVIDFVVLLGLYGEYIDNLGRAGSNSVKPYLGPGFFLALGTTALLVGATVLGWRERDRWAEQATHRPTLL